MTEEKYKLEAEYRKLEAEVGPIKYIAELIYGENVEKDLLEKAVRWVIITIIFVFDPLAVLLLIASQYTFEWRRQDIEAKDDTTEPEVQPKPEEMKYEDVDQETLDKEFEDEEPVKGPHLLKDKEIEELLEKADPQTLEEVAKELGVEKEVDKPIYNPYTDTRSDEELTDEELAQRRNMKLYGPDGVLAANPNGKKVKSVKIKSIAEKAQENEKNKEDE